MPSDDFGLIVKPLKLPWGGVLEPNFPEKSATAGSTARSAPSGDSRGREIWVLKYHPPVKTGPCEPGLFDFIALGLDVKELPKT